MKGQFAFRCVVIIIMASLVRSFSVSGRATTMMTTRTTRTNTPWLRGHRSSSASLLCRPASSILIWRLSTARVSSLFSSVAGASEDEEKVDRRKRLVFLGTPDVAATCLQRLHDASQHPDAPFQVVAVVTQPPTRRRRKGPSMEPSPVGRVANALGVPVLHPDSAKDDTFLTALENDFRPDVCVTAAYGQYLPKRFLNIPQCGTLNIHPSLLPKWRGASPVQRSLEAGDNPVGVTVLFTVSKMDAGPIVAQEAVSIDENDTATTILPLLFDLGTNQLLQVLPDVLSGRITPNTATLQDDTAATQAAMIHPRQAELQVWKESARTCHNRCRGFSMWPQTYLTVRVGVRPELIKLKIWLTRVVSDKPTMTVDPTSVISPGSDRMGAGSSVTFGDESVLSPPVVEDDDNDPTTVIRFGPSKQKGGLYVTCYDGSILELLEVQPPTRRSFRAKDFQNGYPDETIRWVRPSDDDENNNNNSHSNDATVTAEDDKQRGPVIAKEENVFRP